MLNLKFPSSMTSNPPYLLHSSELLKQRLHSTHALVILSMKHRTFRCPGVLFTNLCASKIVLFLCTESNVFLHEPAKHNYFLLRMAHYAVLVFIMRAIERYLK